MEWPQEALRSVATHFLQKACMFTRHTKADLQMWTPWDADAIAFSSVLFPSRWTFQREFLQEWWSRKPRFFEFCTFEQIVKCEARKATER